MMCRVVWAIVRILPLLLASNAHAQTVAEVRAWLLEEIAQSHDRLYPFPNFGGGALTWTHGRFVSGDALSRLRQEISELPDHPNRPLLVQSERRARGEPFGSTWKLWSAGKDRWRLNHDFYTSEQRLYWDSIHMPGRQWDLTAQDLILFEADSDATDKFSNESIGMSALFSLEYLLTMRLARMTKAGLVAGPIRLGAGNTFSFDATTPTDGGGHDYALRFHGYWDPSARRGFITQNTVLVNELDPSIVGRTVTAKSWEYVDAGGFWIATVVEQNDPNDPVTTVYRFIDFSAGDREELDRLTQIPELDGTDPIRGPIESTRFTDHRSGQQIVSYGDGSTQTFRLMTDAETSQTTRRLRLLGWLLLAGILAVLGVIVYKRVVVK